MSGAAGAERATVETTGHQVSEEQRAQMCSRNMGCERMLWGWPLDPKKPLGEERNWARLKPSSASCFLVSTSSSARTKESIQLSTHGPEEVYSSHVDPVGKRRLPRAKASG